MAKYIATRRTWLSHECRQVEEGEIFETTFPSVNGKPMRLSDNLMPYKGEVSKGKGKAESEGGSEDGDVSGELA